MAISSAVFNCIIAGVPMRYTTQTCFQVARSDRSFDRPQVCEWPHLLGFNSDSY